MAYTLNSYAFRGLSTDTKPTTDPSGRGLLPTGSRFIEVDTGTSYDWNGTSWIVALAGLGTVSVGSDVVSSGTYGGKTVGASAVQMIAASNPATKGVLVKADDSNTGSVYVGLSSAVTADAGGANSGIRLAAGSSLLLPVSNANLVYLIGSAASQNVAWMAC